MQLPAPRMWTKCPSMKRTKLERSPDNLAAGLEQRREYVEMVKLLAAINEVNDARRRATNFRVPFCCRRDGGIVRVGQPLNALARHRVLKNSATTVVQP